MKIINNNFKALRNYFSLTQKEFAVQLDVTQANISQVENGSSLPSCTLILKIANCYPNLDLNWLLKGEGRMFKSEKQKTQKLSSEENISQMAKDIKIIYSMVHALADSPSAVGASSFA